MGLYKKGSTQNTFNSEWDAFITAGDMNALAIIYEEHFDLLLNFGHKFCRDESVLEDAIQNIFSKLISSRERLGKISNVKHYLLVAYRNELFTLFNKSKKIIVSEIIPDFHFKPEYSVEDEIIEKEGKAHIKKFLIKSLQKLTPNQQEVLYLKFDLELSYEEISETLNISVKSCRTSIYRSIKMIKADVESMLQKKIQLFFCILRTIC